MHSYRLNCLTFFMIVFFICANKMTRSYSINTSFIDELGDDIQKQVLPEVREKLAKLEKEFNITFDRASEEVRKIIFKYTGIDKLIKKIAGEFIRDYINATMDGIYRQMLQAHHIAFSDSNPHDKQRSIY